MSITIDPAAQENAQNAQHNENNYFLLRALGLLDPDEPGVGHGAGVTVTLEECVVMQGRTQGDNITYGNAIEIDAKNLDQLGLGDDIVTYHMDENGNLELTDHSDTNENNAEGFLLNMDTDVSAWKYDPKSEEYTVTRMNGNDDPSFMIQPVEVDGMLQGYFVQGVTESGSQTGLYLDASAVNLSGMDETMKAELFAAPEASGMDGQNQNLNNDLNQTATLAM
tara:strand:+ start:576 stop:1244 length:669 start_codon:yes stop_codon:yes gene_type:complete